MSETFAATIAAVIPVIWLVASLEAHQLMKPYLAYSQRFEQAAQEGERMLSEAGEQPASERIFAVQTEMNNRLAEIIEDQRTVDPPILFTFWVTFGGILLSAEWMALQWLAESDPGPDPGLAIFLLASTVGGFSALAFVPVAVTMVQATKHRKRGHKRHTALQEATMRLHVRAVDRERDEEPNQN